MTHMRLSIALVYILEFEKWCFTGSPDKAHRKSSSKSNITAFFLHKVGLYHRQRICHLLENLKSRLCNKYDVIDINLSSEIKNTKIFYFIKLKKNVQNWDLLSASICFNFDKISSMIFQYAYTNANGATESPWGWKGDRFQFGYPWRGQTYLGSTWSTPTGQLIV